MKRKRFEGDPIEVLRSADPLDPLEVPRDTSGAHARALFQEVTSMETMERETAPAVRAPRRRFALATAGAALAVIIAAGVALFAGGDAPGEEYIAGGEPIASAAMCAEFYDLTTLANRDVAFDGTLTAVDGDQAVFDVNRWFTGGSGARATLDANGLTGGAITSIGGPGLEVGTRYLVSGSGGFVWACGFTMTYDTGIADEWAGVFGG
jgi:hypothetical protein